MSTVETRAIVKHFDGVRAVDGIDLSAREGEFLVLLGPSGCGKTTLMRMIAGLERPTSGDVLIGGAVVTAHPPRVRNVAMVFQSYALYPHMTVFRNIAFPLRVLRMPKEEIRKRVEWAAQMFGITRLLDRKPRQLSGGERQRVALARAVVREPVVFLLDEPLSNLDAKLRNSARVELKQFQRNIGTTTIYVTHDQVEALGLGDRVAVLNEGRICQIGTPVEVYDHPADTFVATFIGAPPMNLVTQDGWLLGFRPESFLPRAVQPVESGDLVIPVRVERVEYLGADRLAYGTLEAPYPQEPVIANLPSTVSVTLQPGERSEFVVRQRDARRFDKATGRRLEATRAA
ncbi:MAG: ATP-binding cassette domain-containing protein [Gammaproteobacteria bacterium]|nr:ATP-binding cassette domain-containing protein [Gammaproteobacteria bacterium]NIR83578.1 ATP-binding cassette domain-containing protein [Gammaproteobacteria bacterium]NIR91500.1 ATP-binding cassette domain-containing protein [Gammaproteobacteria bacterium]NIU04740.1 ATP-binding cassette domain-containing protein [Gammaproteobacteria bacterium]NIV51782.1 ATP-binding cassette domain-containing protein [Gammaproteobacteria bacterium]